MDKLIDYLGDFVTELTIQLNSDQRRWGDTWKYRPREGQEERIFIRYRDYYDQFINAGQPIPWLKVVGEAFIAWVRENHPEALEK